MADDQVIFGGGQQNNQVDLQQVVEEDPYAKKVRKALAGAKSLQAKQLGESNQAREYYDSHQWSDADRLRMEQGIVKRPAITFNEIKPIVDSVSGLERLNRQDVRFVTRAIDSTLEEDTAGDLATESIAAVLDLCNGESERSRAIRDMAIGGIGWTEARVDYVFSDDPDGRVELRWVDYREMLWDQNARQENLQDASWIARKRFLPRKDFQERWPDKFEQVSPALPDAGQTALDKYRLVTPFWSWQNEDMNPKPNPSTLKPKDSIEVVQFQWREMETVYRITDPENPEGPLKTFRKIEWGDYTKSLQAQGQELPLYARQQMPVYKQIYVSRGIDLDEPIELPRGFSFMALTGLWDQKKECWYGLVRPMIEPQNVINKAISSALQFHLNNAKGGVMFEPDAFVDPTVAKQDWARNDAWIQLNQGGAQKIVQRQATALPSELPLFFDAGRRAMYTTTGLNEELLGLSQGETPSPTTMRRIQSGLAVLGWFFDNVKRYQQTEARTLLEFVREYWSHGQLIQVGGDFNSRAVPLLKEHLPLDYMLVVDDSVRHNPNLKAQIWQDLQGVMPALLRYGFGKFLLYALKFSPLPTQLVQLLQREAAQGGAPEKPGGRGKGQSPEEQAAKVQKLAAEAEKIKAQTENLRADRGLKMAKVVIEGLDSAHTHEHNKELQRHRTLVDALKMIRTRKMGAAGENFSG